MELHRQPAGGEIMTSSRSRAAIAASAVLAAIFLSNVSAAAAQVYAPLHSLETPRLILAQYASRETVREAQQLLGRLGYGAGAADGVAGPQTRRAVRSFQRDSSLSVDGVISPSLLNALRAAARTPPKAASGAYATPDISAPNQPQTAWPTPDPSDSTMLLNVSPPGFSPPPTPQPPSRVAERSQPPGQLVPPPPPAPMPMAAADNNFAPPPPPLPRARAPLEISAPPLTDATPSLLAAPPAMAPPLTMPEPAGQIPPPPPVLESQTFSNPPPPPPQLLAAPLPRADSPSRQASPSLTAPAPLPSPVSVPPSLPIPAPVMTSQAPSSVYGGLLASAPGFRRDAEPALGLNGLTGQTWRFTDDNDAEMELTFEAEGKVSGPAFAEALNWTLDGGELWLLYETSLGGQSARRGRLSGPNAMSGLGESSRKDPNGQSRRWSWRAVRVQ